MAKATFVVMSIEHYERLNARVELFGKLAVAQAQAATGEKGAHSFASDEKTQPAFAWQISTVFVTFLSLLTILSQSSTGL